MNLSADHTYLVLAPHTDDAELGCGGTMARLLELGARVHIVVFSTAEESLPVGSAPDRLEREFHAAMDAMGLPLEDRVVFKYPVRNLHCHRQEILEQLVNLKRELRPLHVFLPSGADLHQDHQIVYQEGLRAFKDVTCWGYELPWNHITFSTQAFCVIQERHLDKKMLALSAYKTQIELSRPYFCREFQEGLARVRGNQIRKTYAEAFEVIRQVV